MPQPKRAASEAVLAFLVAEEIVSLADLCLAWMVARSALCQRLADKAVVMLEMAAVSASDNDMRRHAQSDPLSAWRRPANMPRILPNSEPSAPARRQNPSARLVEATRPNLESVTYTVISGKADTAPPLRGEATVHKMSSL